MRRGPPPRFDYSVVHTTRSLEDTVIHSPQGEIQLLCTVAWPIPVFSHCNIVRAIYYALLQNHDAGVQDIMTAIPSFLGEASCRKAQGRSATRYLMMECICIMRGPGFPRLVNGRDSPRCCRCHAYEWVTLHTSKSHIRTPRSRIFTRAPHLRCGSTCVKPGYVSIRNVQFFPSIRYQ